ncbi:MAG: anaerobic sulfite reductase subunit AsrB [Candidatus Ruminococcus intestinipullorum]|nr:anaerobic sulfite reductase subunit AsrB [Candidatus Ruminococcus intestinipullorum]
MIKNDYVPFVSEIKDVIKHTAIEYTFRMSYKGDVKPGQFFEVSIPKYGEAPISVSGIGEDYVDLTIRKVGKVTNEVFERYKGETLLLRGPYGNGFDVEEYKGKELVVMAGGTGLSPVKGIVDYFANHPEQHDGMTLIAGFKTPNDILFVEEFANWKKAMDVILTVDCAEGDTQCQIGLVTQYIPQLKLKDVKEAVAVVVGPPMMMKFSVQGLLDIGFKEENIWISQERKMCCGLGKCGHCKIGDSYVCLDGPVFNYTKGKELID